MIKAFMQFLKKLEEKLKKLLINYKEKEERIKEKKRNYLKIYCKEIQTTHMDRIENLWKEQIEPIHKANREKILKNKKTDN